MARRRPRVINEARKKLVEAIADAVRRTYKADLSPELSIPDNPDFGDISTNIAFHLAKIARKSPLDIATELASKVDLPEEFSSAEPAGGFVNFRYADAFLQNLLAGIIARPQDFGRLEMGAGRKVQIEFVSANPTGPLNVVSARAAAVGSSLVNILRHAGFDASAEYYINDAGNQVRELGLSVALHVLKLCGLKIELSRDNYRGEYIEELARELLEMDEAKTREFLTKLSSIYANQVFDTALLKELSEIRDALEKQGNCDLNVKDISIDFRGFIAEAYKFSLDRMIDGIRDALQNFNTKFDRFFRESELRESGKVEKLIDRLRVQGDTFEKDGARWFAADRYDEREKPFVLIKSDGEYSYGAVDIAYHQDKFDRSFDLVYDILGPDHHGHIGRMKAAMKALGHEGEFDVLTLQQVNLIEGGEKVKMSKREGKIVTLKELVDDVGVDVARYFFIARRMEAHLDFDLGLARKQSDENPVFYIQYAHARICSILEFAKNNGFEPKLAGREELTELVNPEELALARKMAEWPSVIEKCAVEMAPHHLCFYLHGLAQVFHPFYAKHRVVGDDDRTTMARVALCRSIKEVLALGLGLLGISAPENM